MNLRKFPVIAPDGTEYLVSIEEYSGGYCQPPYAGVYLYVKRKRFGFRKIYGVLYTDGKGVYKREEPDYVAVAAQAVADYYADKRRVDERECVLNAIEQRRQAAAKRLEAWDGRIKTEVSENETA